MDKWVDVDKVAVVTGASFGISEETCKKLVKNGTIIAEFAIKEHRLQVCSKSVIIK